MLPINSKAYVSDTILTEKELLLKTEQLKKQGKIIGVCSGSFDLLHPGHVTHFASAKKHCDILIACVAHDSYNQQKTKTPGRPLFSEEVRAFMVSQLKPVDYVVYNDSITDIFKLIKPHVYIKGPDYKSYRPQALLNEIAAIEAVGGKIAYTDDEKLSTTEILKYIKEHVDC